MYRQPTGIPVKYTNGKLISLENKLRDGLNTLKRLSTDHIRRTPSIYPENPVDDLVDIGIDPQTIKEVEKVIMV